VYERERETVRETETETETESVCIIFCGSCIYHLLFLCLSSHCMERRVAVEVV
jgi:hypothetical protein